MTGVTRLPFVYHSEEQVSITTTTNDVNDFMLLRLHPVCSVNYGPAWFGILLLAEAQSV